MSDQPNVTSPAIESTAGEKTCGCGPDCNCGPDCACGSDGKCAPACTCDAST